MAVVDSSFLIPFARAGRLGLIRSAHETLTAPEQVRKECVAAGKKGASAIRDAFDEWIDAQSAAGTDKYALDGIADADAAVLALAERTGQRLLANDKALIAVARTRGIECVWPTGFLLERLAAGALDATETKQALYELVQEGMNLDPKIYARIQKRIEEHST